MKTAPDLFNRFHQIRLLGSPVLRTPPPPVTDFDSALRTTITQMRELMRLANGVGLAANQIGFHRAVFVWRLSGDSGVMCNPVVEFASTDREFGHEGCLSLPDARFVVPRPQEVVVSGQDEHGADIQVRARGLKARVFCHEIDHLRGKVISDYYESPEAAAE